MTTIVIFGALGDLTRRKLLPALYHLYCKGHLPEDMHLVGIDQHEKTNEEFRAHLQEGVQQFSPDIYTPDSWANFSPSMGYTAANVTNVADFEHIDAYISEFEAENANRLYYFAVPPFLHGPISEGLGSMGMTTENGSWRRVIVEKPFGDDLKSAQALNDAIQEVFRENQIYRIDHYLGKETAQNIIFMRFANTLFELMWNRNYIDNVQITVAESVDVGHRAGYYDHAGVLRDMFQNHLLQLLALIAMEPPASLNANALRNEKVKLLEAVRPIALENTVRGQYTDYRKTDGVDPHSQTPTFAALKLYIDNWRWQGVPFYLRSGKVMPEKVSEIVIQLKHPPHVMFDLPPGEGFNQNQLSICIQPDEGIHFTFEAKFPDSQEARSVNMEFHYADSFGECRIPDAYERLIMDALQGDAALFIRSDEIEAAWRIIDPIIEAWDAGTVPLEIYERGTWGPSGADDLLYNLGHIWQHGCAHD